MISNDDARLSTRTYERQTAPRGSWRFITAIGLIAAALASIVVAIIAAHLDVRWYPPDSLLVVAVVAIGILVAFRVDRVLAGRRLMSWIAWLVPVLISAAVGAAGLAALIQEHRRGFPGLGATSLVAVGIAGVAGGLMLAAPLEVPKRRMDAAITVLVSVLVAVAAMLGAAGVAESLDRRVLDHDTAAEADVPPIPATVGEVAWSTTVPGVITDLIPAGIGAIAEIDDGIVAIDGETGSLRWHYRHRGMSTSDMTASPDGTSVLLEMKQRGRDDSRTIGLDALTGELRFELDVTGFRTGTIVTNYAFLAETDDRIVAHSLVSGDEIWDWDSTVTGSECVALEFYPAPSSFIARCVNLTSEYSLVSVDSMTGSVEWRIPREDLDISDVRPTGDGTAAIRLDGADYTDLDLVSGTPFDPQFDLPAEIGRQVDPQNGDGRRVWMTDDAVAVGNLSTGEVVSLERPADTRLEVVLDESIVFSSDWEPGSNDQLVVVVVVVGGRTIEVELPATATEAELVSTPGAIMVFDRFDFQEVPDSTIVGLR